MNHVLYYDIRLLLELLYSPSSYSNEIHPNVKFVLIELIYLMFWSEKENVNSRITTCACTRACLYMLSMLNV